MHGGAVRMAHIRHGPASSCTQLAVATALRLRPVHSIGDPGGLRLGAVIGEPNRGCVDRTAELVGV